MHKHVHAGVLNVAFLETGKPHGWPVVLLHGFPYDVHAYDEVAPRLAEKGARVIALKVSAPFHCGLMAPAAGVVASELERVDLRAPSIPVVANVDAAPNSEAARAKELLIRQIDGPVRWEETVRFLASSGVTHALEIGPGKVLAGLVKRIAKDIKVLSVGDCASIDAAQAFVADACQT